MDYDEALKAVAAEVVRRARAQVAVVSPDPSPQDVRDECREQVYGDVIDELMVAVKRLL